MMRQRPLGAWWAVIGAVVSLGALAGTALAVTAAKPEGEMWRVDFESDIPHGTRAQRGAIQRMADGSAAVGKGCLRYRLPSRLDSRSCLVLPLPAGLSVPRDGKLSVWVKTRGSEQPAHLRWFALDASDRPLFQRRFRLDKGAGWKRLEWDVFQWRWGNRHVGDWSEVKAIAILAESDVRELWLDEIRLVTADDPQVPASIGAPEQWLAGIAFEDRETRVLVSEDFVIFTDAVKEIGEPEMEQLYGQVLRVRRWARRQFGDAVRPVADATPAKFLIFRDKQDYVAFFRALGEQWECSISPPQGEGYTVQDISACPYDPGYGIDCPVFLHEAVHGVVTRDLRVPTGTAEHSWLQEGLANYLQLCVYPESMDREVYVRNFRRPIGSKSFFRPLREICRRRVQPRHYAQVASVVAFLAAERPDWLREIARGPARNRGLDAVLAELGTDLPHLEQLWFAWGRKTFAPDADPPEGEGTHFALPREWQPQPAEG